MVLLPWLVLLLVTAIFADAPLLRGGLPLGDDTPIHLYRLVDLDHLIRNGILYSRWQPDLVYGYGSPLFKYYAPLSAYLDEAGHLLGFSFRGGMALVFALLPLIAGAATYAFLLRRLGTGPALLGGIAYPTSLYALYDIWIRGSISDAVAMALFPIVLLALDWLADKPGPGRAAVVAVAYAAALLGHEVTGPMLLPLLIMCGVWWARGDRRTLAWLAGSLGLGIGLTLFFYGPAVLGVAETRVPWYLAQPGTQYGQHFTSLNDLLVIVPTAYPGAMLTNLPIGIGLIQLVLGLAALGGISRLKQRERGEVVIFAVSLIVCTVLAEPLSNPIWQVLPLLRIMQYPWRLLAMATFVNSLLIGYLGHELFVARRAVGAIGMAIIALVLLVVAVPYLYPLPGNSLPANPTLHQVTLFQQTSGALGSTSDAELLPGDLKRFPPGPPFPGADEGATLAAKLDRSTLPNGATVHLQSSNQFQAVLNLASPSPFVARFDVFWFPGWTATLDGRDAPVQASGPYSTLSVMVPAGQHRLVVSFGETHRDLAFDALSLLALLAALGLGARGIWGWLKHRAPSPSSKEPIESVWSRASVGGITLASLVGIIFLWGFANPGLTPLVQPFDGQHPPGMAVASPHQVGNSFVLLGYTVSPATPHPGDSVSVTLYWKTNAPLPTNYSSFVHVIGSANKMVGQEDNVHVANFPTSRWRVGAYARDVHTFQLASSLAPGTYQVDVGIYDRATGHQLPIRSGPGAQGDTLDLFPLKVAPTGR